MVHNCLKLTFLNEKQLSVYVVLSYFLVNRGLAPPPILADMSVKIFLFNAIHESTFLNEKYRLQKNTLCSLLGMFVTAF